MTAAPGSARTLASQAFFMAASFRCGRARAARPHDEPDRMARSVGRHVHAVDHVADEEQSPAARPLLALELRQQVRLFDRSGGGVLTAEVADGDDDVVAVLDHLDVHRDLRAALVAVLDGIHGGFGHGRLEPLQPGRGQPVAGHRLRDPGPRHPLVARFAGHGERVEPASGRMSHRCHVPPPAYTADMVRSRLTSVMSSSCSASGPVNAPSSVRHRSMRSSPDAPRPASSATRGKPNISRSGACASASPSLCSSAQSPGSNWKVFSSYSMPGIRPRGMPRARSSATPLAVRTYGTSCPALANSTLPLSGSSTRARQVTNMWAGMSAHSRSFTCASTAPGEISRGAAPRSSACVLAITRAAGIPLSVTSPTTNMTLPSGSGMKS